MNKDRFQQFFHCVGAAFQTCFLPCSIGIKQEKILRGIVFFICKTDQIRTHLPGFFVINPVDGFIARICDLLGILGNFDLWNKLSVFVLDRGQLIYSSEGRTVFGSDQIRPYSPGSNGCALNLQIIDQKFIQIIGSSDDGVGKSCLIQHFSCFF